jgi:hypothetical protein
METPYKIYKKGTTLRSNVLKILSHTTWRSWIQTLIQIYYSLIRSKLKHGAEIYSSAKNPMLKIIDPIHNLNLRLSVGGFKSSPVKSIYVTANEPSLYIRRIKIALTFTTKLKKKQPRSINIGTHYSDYKNISNKSFQYNKIRNYSNPTVIQQN